MKTLYKILIGICIIVLLIVIGLFLRGNKDTWICDNGNWVAHGNPSAPIPTEKCGDDNNDNVNNNICIPNIEICNGTDDDCDGLMDEGNVCGGDLNAK